MQELIKVTNEGGKQTVNARDLHSFLESKKDFSSWIKSRIEKYNFVENVDYTLLTQKVAQLSGAKYLKEYHITLDMAKELSMVERNDKGKQARQYFIECEKQLLAIKPALTYEELMQQALLMADAKVKELQCKIKEDAPKVAFAEAIEVSCNSILIRDWVKAISTAEKVSIGQNKAFAWLRYNGYLMKNNQPYQRYIDNGYFEVQEQAFATPKGVKTSFTTKVTGKGQVALANKIVDDFK